MVFAVVVFAVVVFAVVVVRPCTVVVAVIRGVGCGLRGVLVGTEVDVVVMFHAIAQVHVVAGLQDLGGEAEQGGHGHAAKENRRPLALGMVHLEYLVALRELGAQAYRGWSQSQKGMKTWCRRRGS
jgi:hypothetical protein